MFCDFFFSSVKWPIRGTVGPGHGLLTDNFQIFLLIFFQTPQLIQSYTESGLQRLQNESWKKYCQYAGSSEPRGLLDTLLRTIMAAKSQWRTLKATMPICLVFLEALLNLSHRIPLSYPPTVMALRFRRGR